MFHRIWFCFSKTKHLILIGQEDNLPPVNQHLAALFVLQVRWTETIKHVELWPHPIHLHWVLLTSKPSFYPSNAHAFLRSGVYSEVLQTAMMIENLIIFFLIVKVIVTSKGFYVDMVILPAQLSLSKELPELISVNYYLSYKHHVPWRDLPVQL